jgi:hypothetical protein
MDTQPELTALTVLRHLFVTLNCLIDLHKQTGAIDDPVCENCNQLWPCDTLATLNAQYLV